MTQEEFKWYKGKYIVNRDFSSNFLNKFSRIEKLGDELYKGINKIYIKSIIIVNNNIILFHSKECHQSYLLYSGTIINGDEKKIIKILELIITNPELGKIVKECYIEENILERPKTKSKDLYKKR